MFIELYQLKQNKNPKTHFIKKKKNQYVHYCKVLTGQMTDQRLKVTGRRTNVQKHGEKNEAHITPKMIVTLEEFLCHPNF